LHPAIRAIKNNHKYCHQVINQEKIQISKQLPINELRINLSASQVAARDIDFKEQQN